ncbi:hypothetical protein PO878_08070 [Iamia majanohamensis]|uniref:Uncharacterized protein n=1 Tax=Iamia majanohamensis TaxID=467976 RepID=A0AAE9YCI4_9ACTN|nr:hypothetical protein [Iamia majanohamensis]WCO68683.1 hypothetical protein PO878_08070 [Iamia majanohamensis]
MKKLIYLFAAAMLILNTGACSDDDSDSSATTTQAQPDAEVNEQDAEAETSTTDGEEEPEDLTDLALALDDLPAGWAENNSEGDDSDPVECLEPLDDNDDLEGTQTGEAEVAYMRGTGVPQLDQLLVELPDDAEASEALDLIAGVIEECGEFEESDDDGEAITGQIGRVQLDPIEGAERQETFQLTATTQGINVSAAMVLLQKGPYLTFLVLTDTGSFDPAEAAEFATTAVDKL